MTEPEDLTLHHLRDIRAGLDRVLTELGTVNNRLSALEQHMTAVHLDDHTTRQQLDQVSARLERIEKRLGLIEA